MFLHLIGFVAAVSLSDASFVPRLQRFEIAAALDEHGTEEAAQRNQKSEEVDQSAVVATEKKKTIAQPQTHRAGHAGEIYSEHAGVVERRACEAAARPVPCPPPLSSVQSADVLAAESRLCSGRWMISLPLLMMPPTLSYDNTGTGGETWSSRTKSNGQGDDAS